MDCITGTGKKVSRSKTTHLYECRTRTATNVASAEVIANTNLFERKNGQMCIRYLLVLSK